MSAGNSFLVKARARAKALKREIIALALAYRDPRTPLAAKIVTAVVVAYALSPIDLIPDFIPVLGLVDDLLLLPLGISIAIKMIPKPVLESCRKKAEETEKQGSSGAKIAALIIVLFWLAVAVFIFLWVRKSFR